MPEVYNLLFLTDQCLKSTILTFLFVVDYAFLSLQSFSSLFPFLTY